MTMRLSTSRPLGVAEKLLGKAIDAEAVYAKQVVLTGEAAVLSTANGRACFFNSLRLLSRVVGNLIVFVPPPMRELYEDAIRYASTAYSIRPLKVVRELPRAALANSIAILHVGARVSESGLPVIRIGAQGWIACVATNSALPMAEDCTQDNPMAALMAASLGVSEVFKRVFAVPPEIAEPIDAVEFSLFELSCRPTHPGPALAPQILLPNTLMVGGGAIGNGVTLLLSQLPLHGRIHIVDKQVFAEENFGTCVLLESVAWLGQSKARALAAKLHEPGRLEVTGEQLTIETALSNGSLDGFAIDLLLSGLDQADPRRTNQRLWPSVLVDGGINEVGAAVTQYRVSDPQRACLQCWFEPTLVDARIQQAMWTGLSTESLTDLGRPLSEQDTEAAESSKRAWLAEREGKPICSVITEAQLVARLGVDTEPGFRPSVPFVATAAAALVVAEAIKALLFPEVRTPAQFQLANLFQGPEFAASLERAPTPTCSCRVHRAAIETAVRRRRSNVPLRAESGMG